MKDELDVQNNDNVEAPQESEQPSAVEAQVEPVVEFYNNSVDRLTPEPQRRAQDLLVTDDVNLIQQADEPAEEPVTEPVAVAETDQDFGPEDQVRLMEEMRNEFGPQTRTPRQPRQPRQPRVEPNQSESSNDLPINRPVSYTQANMNFFSKFTPIQQ